MKEEFRPRLRLAITMPSKACERLRSPSTTLTFTITVSPGEKSGTSFLRRLISSCSSVLIRSISTSLLLELFQQSLLFRAQRLHAQQIRTPQPRPAQRLLQPPAPDVLMVPRHQYFRHPAPALIRPRLGPRVLRAVQQTVRERLFQRRGLVAEGARQLAHHRVDQRHRGELAAREHEVADGHFLVDPALEQPLVHALVPAAQQGDRALLRKLHHPAVIQLLALRRQVNNPATSCVFHSVERSL